jgi:hypothetical protein
LRVEPPIRKSTRRTDKSQEKRKGKQPSPLSLSSCWYLLSDKCV